MIENENISFNIFKFVILMLFKYFYISDSYEICPSSIRKKIEVLTKT